MTPQGLDDSDDEALAKADRETLQRLASDMKLVKTLVRRMDERLFGGQRPGELETLNRNLQHKASQADLEKLMLRLWGDPASDGKPGELGKYNRRIEKLEAAYIKIGVFVSIAAVASKFVIDLLSPYLKSLIPLPH